jgi:hypothetical protein
MKPSEPKFTDKKLTKCQLQVCKFLVFCDFSALANPVILPGMIRSMFVFAIFVFNSRITKQRMESMTTTLELLFYNMQK